MGGRRGLAGQVAGDLLRGTLLCGGCCGLRLGRRRVGYWGFELRGHCAKVSVRRGDGGDDFSPPAKKFCLPSSSSSSFPSLLKSLNEANLFAGAARRWGARELLELRPLTFIQENIRVPLRNRLWCASKLRLRRLRWRCSTPIVVLLFIFYSGL